MTSARYETEAGPAYGRRGWGQRMAERARRRQPGQVAAFRPEWCRGWRGLLLRAVWSPAPAGQPGISGGQLVGALSVALGLFLTLEPHLRGATAVTVPSAGGWFVAVALPSLLRALTAPHVRIVAGQGDAAQRLHLLLAVLQDLEEVGRRAGHVPAVADGADLAPRVLWEAAGYAVVDAETGQLPPELEQLLKSAQALASRARMVADGHEAQERRVRYASSASEAKLGELLDQMSGRVRDLEDEAAELSAVATPRSEIYAHGCKPTPASRS